MHSVLKTVGAAATRAFRQNVRCMSVIPPPNRKPDLPPTKVMPIFFTLVSISILNLILRGTDSGMILLALD